MADDARQEFTIDASEAINAMEKLQQEFLKYNEALGTIIETNRRLNQTSGQVITSFTQVDEAGRKVISTLEGDAEAYRILATSVGTASAAQRKYTADINEAIAANKRLADAINQVSKASQLQLPGKPLGQLPFIPSKPAIPLGPGFTGFPGGPPRFPPNITGFPTGPGGSFGPFPRGPAGAFSRPPDIGRLSAQYAGVITQAEKLNTVTNTFHGTLALIGRVASIQLLHRAVVGLIYSIEDGIQVSSEFYRQIGLIQTLSQDTGESFDKWSSEVKKVANEFGKPATEVAQAAYEGLSNQVIKSTADFEFLRRAVEFSRVTNSTAADSIDLFSSAINSFDLSVQDSEKIARTFFTTIDIGRVKADELANTFGRVGPLAKLLGVNFEETNASISALSLAGTRGNDAITLLTNVIRTLIKPGEELKKVLHDAGFESGQAAVQALGFTGTLELLKNEIDGNAERLGQLFPELRGLKGAAVLAGEGFDTFKRAIKEATQGTANYENAVKLVNENTGQKFQDQLQKIANFFTVDIGGKFLQNIIAIGEKFGGLVEIVKGFTDIAGKAALILGGLFAANKIIAFSTYLADAVFLFSSMVKETTLATAALRAFGYTGSISMGLVTAGLTTIIGLFTFAALEGYQSAQRIENAYQNSFDSLEKQAQSLTKELNKGADQQKEAFERGIGSQEQTFYQFSAAIQRTLNDLVERAQEAGNRIRESLQDSFEILGNTLKKNVNQFEEDERKAADNIKSLQRSQIDNQRQAERALFERRLDFLKDRFGKTGQGQDAIFELSKSRSDLLARQGTALFKKGDIQEAERSFDESIRVLEQLNSGRRAQYDTESLINQRYRERLALENKEIANQQQIEEKARQRANEERANFKVIQDLFERLQKFKVTDKEGKLLPDFKNSQDALQKLNELQNQLLDKLSGVGLTNKLPLAKDFAEQVNKVKELLGGQAQGAQLDVSLINRRKRLQDFNEEFQKTSDKGKKTNTELTSQFKQNNEALIKSKQSAVALFNSFQVGGKEAVASFSNTGKSLVNLLGGAGNGPIPFSEKFQKLNKQTAEALQNVTPENASETIRQVFALRDQLLQISNKRNTTFTGIANAPGSFDTETKQARSLIQTLDAVIEKIKEIRNTGDVQKGLQEQISGNTQQTTANLNALTQQIQTMTPSAEALKIQFDNIGAASGKINGVTESLGGMTGELNAAIGAAERLRKELESIPPAPGGRVPGKAFGGVVSQYASDSMLIGAQPGEFVVRNPYAQQFNPILEAINSGHGDSYVNNQQSRSVNIGDINITVQGGQTEQQTLSAIARGLQRAVRSRTLKLD